MSKLTKLTSTAFNRRGGTASRFNWTLKSTISGLATNFLSYRNNTWFTAGRVSGVDKLYSSSNLLTWTDLGTIVDPATAVNQSIVRALEYNASTANFLAYGYGDNLDLNFRKLTGGNYSGPWQWYIESGYGRYMASATDGTYKLIVGYSRSGTINTIQAFWGYNSPAEMALNVVDGRSTASYPDKSLNGVAIGNGVFVIVGNYNYITYNTSVSTAFLQPASVFTSFDDIVGIAFGNGVFVIVTNTGKIATSTNGATWTVRTQLPTGVASDVTFGAGVFLISNRSFWNPTNFDKSYTSTDGITWTLQPTLSSTSYSTFYGDSTQMVYAVGDGRIFTAT